MQVFRSMFRQAIGLMFQKPNDVYVFDFGSPVQHSFHMFFVFWPIDVYFFDDKGKLIDKKLDFRPFTWYFPKQKYVYAVEIATGRKYSEVNKSIKSYVGV